MTPTISSPAAHAWHLPHVHLPHVPHLPHVRPHRRAPPSAPYDRYAAHRQGLDVRDSLLPGAELGLFAMRAFERGRTITTYHGRVLHLKEVLRLSAAEREAVMSGFGMDTYVDAGRDMNVLARYVNDPFEPHAVNAEFVRVLPEHRALLVATRDIEPGEEIYASSSTAHRLFRLPPSAPTPPSTPVHHVCGVADGVGDDSSHGRVHLRPPASPSGLTSPASLQAWMLADDADTPLAQQRRRSSHDASAHGSDGSEADSMSLDSERGCGTDAHWRGVHEPGLATAALPGTPSNLAQ